MKKSRLLTLTAAGLLLSGAALAADCSAVIEGNDQMQFNLKSMTVPASCKDFTVTLKHVGKAPKAAMGHNWVLTKAADMDTVGKEGLAAGPSKDYLKADDPKIIAHAKMIGGGETSSVTFAVGKLKEGEEYMYFCTFPGHIALMKGSLKVVK